jgi:hypothetical protein
MSTEREDLDNLLKSPGWQRVAQWANADLAAKLSTHMEAAAAEMDDVQALSRLRQVMAAKKAVDLVLAYPDARLRELTAHAAHAERVPVLNRRGGL